MYLVRRKNGFYYIQFFDPITNQIKRKSTGTKSKRDAQKILRQFKPSEKNPLPKIKISTFRGEYVRHLTGNKTKAYIKSINLSFRQLINYCKDIPIQNLSVKVLDQFISKRFSTSPSAALLYYRTLKAAFSVAVNWGYIYDNPLKKVKPPRQKKSLPVFLSKSEFDSILSHTPTKLLKDIFVTAFNSGMRLGEIVNLVWDCVSFNRKIITVKNINGFITKNKKERIIPMNNILIEVFLNRYQSTKMQNENNYIFYRVIGVRLNEDYVSKQFKYAVRSAGLSEDIHFHSLRHSFASNLIQKGASIYVVKELLGHESISTTQIYSHLQNENLIQAISLLED